MRAWPSLDQLGADSNLDVDVTLLRRHEVGLLIELLRGWYPEVRSGAESVHLDERFYDRVLLEGDPPSKDKKIYLLVFRGRGGNPIIGFLSFDRHDHTRMLYGRLMAVSPDQQRRGLGRLGMRLELEVARLVGAELILNFATLKHIGSQRLMESCGFQPVGIVPAFDRDQMSEDQVKRVYEVLYAKVMCSPEDILTPRTENMTPRVREIYAQLFEGAAKGRGHRP